MSISVDGSQFPLDVGESSSPTSSPIKPVIETSDQKRTHEAEILTTPAVRNLAKQHGIDVNDVPGTGKHGRVQKEDILNYVASIKNNSNPVKPTTLEPEQTLHQDKTLPIRYSYRVLQFTIAC